MGSCRTGLHSAAPLVVIVINAGGGAGRIVRILRIGVVPDVVSRIVILGRTARDEIVAGRKVVCVVVVGVVVKKQTGVCCICGASAVRAALRPNRVIETLNDSLIERVLQEDLPVLGVKVVIKLISFP